MAITLTKEQKHDAAMALAASRILSGHLACLSCDIECEKEGALYILWVEASILRRKVYHTLEGNEEEITQLAEKLIRKFYEAGASL